MPTRINFLTKDIFETLYYKKDLSYKEMSKILKTSQSSICRFAKKNNFPKKNKRINRQLKLNETEIVNLYKRGKSMNYISKLFGVDLGTIRKRLIKNSVSIKKIHEKSLKNLERTEERKMKHRKSMLGSNNHNWKGGKNLKERIRKHLFYKKWRNKCFLRDNYICQLCKVRGGKLNVDHIKPFALIIKENNIDSIQKAEKCFELWNLKNGRTLCVKCHRKTKTWGFGTIKLLDKN